MSQYEQIWKILSEYNFDIEVKDLENISCEICQNIVNNAHSGPCDCIYCKDCIGVFLLGGEKFCVGNTKKCQKKKLNIERNIFRNDKVNKIVSKTIVKCPSIMCDYECSLMKLCDHLKFCSKNPIFCPYKEMGCNFQIERAHMSNHLLAYIYDHNKLLIQWNVNKEKKNKSDIEKELKEISKHIEEAVIDSSQAFNEEIQKQNKSMDLMLTELTSVKIKNEEFASLIKEMEETIANQNKKISEFKQVVYNRRFVRNISESNTANCSQKSLSNFKHTYFVKSRSSTFGAAPSKLHITPDKDLKRSKTTIISSNEKNSGQRKGFRHFGEFINSFN